MGWAETILASFAALAAIGLGFMMFFGPSMASRALTNAEKRSQNYGCLILLLGCGGAVLIIRSFFQ